MFCKLIVVLVCLMGSTLGKNSLSPLLLWNTNYSTCKPAFNTILPNELAEVLEPLAKESMFVVFMEPWLKTSDFRCSKSSGHESCFKYLKEDTTKIYFANVNRPIEELQKISSKIERVNVDINGDLENDVACEYGKSILIPLSDDDSIPRHELLETHDSIMASAVKNLAKKCKITAFYTRAQSTTNDSKNRRRRATETATSGTMFRSNKDFLIYFTELAVKEAANKETQIKITEMTLTKGNSTSFTVNMSGGLDKLSFLISLSGGYFSMSNLMLNGEAFYVPSEINSPTDFSYACGNQTFYTNTTESSKIIVWNSLQMQAPFNEATPDNFNFGDPWYCVGFFSSGILAGLFVVFILLGIMSVGICWMLDINTMDRFDDPKGKTITINVNE